MRTALLVLVLLLALSGPSIAPVLAVVASEPTLARDINTNRRSAEYVGSDADGFATIDGVTFFSAEDPARGRELWRTDRTPAGTRLVLDINPGAPNSNPGPFVAFRGVAYFGAFDAERGCGLWRSDGTAGGTRPVFVFPQGACRSADDPAPRFLTVVDGTLYFSAADGVHGVELWRSDGTEAGTRLVKNINTDVSSEGKDFSSFPSFLTAVGSTVLFLARDQEGGFEALWRSDGTVDGTWKLLDERVQTPGYSGFPRLGNTVLLTTYGQGATMLWRSDGTAAGTQPFATIDTSPMSDSRGRPLAVEMQNRVFFLTAEGSESGSFGLWATDGTADGTVPIVRALPSGGTLRPENLVASGAKLFFTLPGASRDLNLWVSDGTSEGTRQLTDLTPDSTPGIQIDASELTDVNGVLYFAGSDAEHGCEIWRSDGMPGGTRLVTNLNPDTAPCPHPDSPGPNIPVPSRLSKAGERLVFMHDDGVHGLEPFVTNGTEPGTMLLHDIDAAGDQTGDSVDTLRSVTIGERILFNAFDGESTAVFASDGSASGTVSIVDGEMENAGVAGDGAVIVVRSREARRELWGSDGTLAGSARLADLGVADTFPLVAVVGTLNGAVLLTLTDAEQRMALWRSDATAEGTFPLDTTTAFAGLHHARVRNASYYWASGRTGRIDLWRVDSDEAVSRADAWTQTDGTLVFFAANGNAGYFELWRSDGSEAGTVRIKDLGTGLIGGSNETAFISDRLYYAARYPAHGTELWVSDGTESGTRLVKDIAPGVLGSDPFAFTELGGRLLFVADDGVAGQELWSSDGSEAGTRLVKDIRLGIDDAVRGDLARVDDAIVFVADDGERVSLWRSDGSEAGTEMVMPLNPRFDGNSENVPHLFTIAESALFPAYVPDTGYEPWISDGTLEGTRPFADIAPGSAWSRPDDFVQAGSRLYFTADDTRTGRELWSVALASAAECVGDCNGDANVTIDEVVRGVGVALGTVEIDRCRSLDRSADGQVTVEELVAAVRAALTGC